MSSKKFCSSCDGLTIFHGKYPTIIHCQYLLSYLFNKQMRTSSGTSDSDAPITKLYVEFLWTNLKLLFKKFAWIIIVNNSDPVKVMTFYTDFTPFKI